MTPRGIRFGFGHGVLPDVSAPEEQLQLYALTVNATVISSTKHNIDVTVRAGPDHPTEAEGTLLAGVPVELTLTNAMFATGETFLVNNTKSDGTGRTVTRAVLFTEAVGFEYHAETSDDSEAFYSVEGTSPAPAYTLTVISAPSTGETNQTSQVVVEVTDDNQGGAIVPGVTVAAVSGYPTHGGTAPSAITQSNGRATINWTFGDVETTQQLQLETPSTGDTTSVIDVTVTEPPATGNVTVTEINTGGGTVNSTIARTLEFRRVSDNGLVSGLVVAIASGFPTPSGSAVGGTTDGSGRVTVNWTLGANEDDYNLRVETPATGQAFDLTTATASAAAAGTSPHWEDMAVSVFDYATHWKKNQGNPEWDEQIAFLASVADYVIGGSPVTNSDYVAANSAIRLNSYILAWAPGRNDAYPNPPLNWAPSNVLGGVIAMESWLSQNGFTVEDAYLHYAGGASEQANRIDARVFPPSNTANVQECLQLRNRWCVNPGDPGFRAWMVQRVQQLVAGIINGVFIDEFNTVVQASKGAANFTNGLSCPAATNIPGVNLEYASDAARYADWQSLFGLMRAQMPTDPNSGTKYIILNPAGYANQAADQANIIAAGAGLYEFCNNPYASGVVGRWTALENIVAGGAVMHVHSEIKVNNKHTTSILSVTGINASNYNTPRERTCMAERCFILMCRHATNPRLLVFSPFATLSDSHSLADIMSSWQPAFEVSIGNPTGDRINSGTAGGNSQIWRRHYLRGAVEHVVIFRARTASGAQNGGTQVTYNLPAGTWRLMNADGSYGSSVTSIGLALGEGVIMKKD